ncbi:hypothetical protein AYL99_08553 [Fonsecaea erecta]|uniref:Uncharacterized protein n=1 Tax=Fonsecaea erecta TaxID=1367422 RepID=A0A178ZFH7_9EURO|nr:hypothetical protein AYL99_08553 [Fonsecaea erecta]OAP57815.1 hypothetical protein AYL99_08553 [Fonsecaea erecta]
MIRPADGVDAIGSGISDRRGEDTTSTSDLPGTANHPDTTPSISLLPPDLEEAFSCCIAEFVNADHLARKRVFLTEKATAAQEEYEKEQRRSSQFPDVIDQAEQTKKRIEADRDVAKVEEDMCVATRKTQCSRYLRLQSEHFATDLHKCNEALSARVRALEQDQKNRASQQADAIMLSRIEFEKQQSRIQRLEESYVQQVSWERKAKDELATRVATLEAWMRESAVGSDLNERVKQIEQELGQLVKSVQQVVDTSRERLNLLEQQSEQYKDALDPIRKELEDLKSSRDREDVAKIDKEQKSLWIKLAGQANLLQTLKLDLDKVRSPNGPFAEHGVRQAEHDWLCGKLEAFREEIQIEKHLHFLLALSTHIAGIQKDLYVAKPVGHRRISVCRVTELENAVSKLKDEVETLCKDRSLLVRDSSQRDSVGPKTDEEDSRRQSQEPRVNPSNDAEDSTAPIARVEADQPTDRGLAGGAMDAPQASIDATDRELTQNRRQRSSKPEKIRRSLRSAAHGRDAPSDDATFGPQATHDNTNDGAITDADAPHQVSDDDDHDLDEAVPKTSKKPATPRSKRPSMTQAPQSSPRQSKRILKRKQTSQGITIDLTEDDEDDVGHRSRRIRR